MAWPLLCTYQRGEPRNWNPSNDIRMLHAKEACASLIFVGRECLILGLPFAS